MPVATAAGAKPSAFGIPDLLGAPLEREIFAFDEVSDQRYWGRAMKQGDTVKIVASSHSDVPTGCVGTIQSPLGGGYGVTITAEFFIPGVVPFQRLETRNVWFPANHLEVTTQEQDSSACDMPAGRKMETGMFGARGCASCDQALVRSGS